ncbi:hypothetical protein F4824DRAFT_495808 [Ustulina deusta]|nr:hypothetical protein F4824DRAFT_495808 [Ustulina deusta]
MPAKRKSKPPGRALLADFIQTRTKTSPPRNMLKKKYDAFLKDSPPPKVKGDFGKEFDLNAFDKDSGDTDPERDNDSSEDDNEKQYPSPTENIQKGHALMTPHVKSFFGNLDGPSDQAALKGVKRVNRRIEKNNQKHNRLPLAIYQVPSEKLIFCRYAQRQIAISFETGLYDPPRVQKELSWLQEHFTKTCRRGLYQWPTTWTQLLMDPLSAKLKSLGLGTDQKSTQKTKDEELSDAEMTNGSELFVSDEEESEEEDEKMTDVPRTDLIKEIQPLRPGFTIFGDRILGYQPMRRRSKMMKGAEIITGFRFIVQVDGPNPIKVATGSEIGHAAAMAYHQLPDGERNEIGKEAAKYAAMDPAEFEGIEGLATVPGSSGPNRLGISYVLVKVRTPQQKSPLMVRTTLRAWIGASMGDKYIDNFCVRKNFVPEWAAMGFLTDPANDSKYLRLAYPPPRQNAHYSHVQPLAQTGRFPALPPPGQTAHYNLRPLVQNSDMQALLPPRGEDGGVQELSRKFDQLLELFIKGHEEAREDRKQQREIMSRLLPAP